MGRNFLLIFTVLMLFVGCYESDQPDPTNPEMVFNDLGQVVNVEYGYQGIARYSITSIRNPENLFSIESESEFNEGDYVILEFTFLRVISSGGFLYKLSQLIAYDENDMVN